MKILLEISYEGTRYAGWQTQRNQNQKTIQDVLEEALSQLTGQRIRTLASGRTDAGVHAISQPVQFITESTIPPDRYKPALNTFLPEDVRVVRSLQVPETFHVIGDVRRKTYLYRILLDSDPDVFRRHLVWAFGYPLDWEAMRQGADILQGIHDFRGFCASKSNARTFVRTVHRITLSQWNDELQIEVCGSGFLQHMVRIIVGTLVEIGQKRMSMAQLDEALGAGRRDLAGPTAPARGLYLKEVTYNGIWL